MMIEKFARNIDQARNTGKIFSIYQETKETILGYSQGNAKVL